MPTAEEPEQVSPVSSPKPWQKPRPKASADTPTPGEEFLHSLPSSLTAHRGAAPRKRKPDADAEQDIDTAKIFRTCAEESPPKQPAPESLPLLEDKVRRSYLADRALLEAEGHTGLPEK